MLCWQISVKKHWQCLSIPFRDGAASFRRVDRQNKRAMWVRLWQAAKKRKNKALYKKLLPGKLNHLTPLDRRHIAPIPIKYAHVFNDNENDFKCTNVIEHQIHVSDVKSIRKPPDRTPYALRQEMQNQVQKMLDKGVISPSNSWWSSVILVPKEKGPDGKPQYRFCVDFRALNSIRYLLALLGAHHILHISSVRVKLDKGCSFAVLLQNICCGSN